MCDCCRAKADVDAENRAGETALYHAEEREAQGIIDVLQEAAK